MNAQSIIITFQDAKEWAETENKYALCLDMMGMSADHPSADDQVEELESRLELLYNQECEEVSTTEQMINDKPASATHVNVYDELIEFYRFRGNKVQFWHNDECEWFDAEYLPSSMRLIEDVLKSL